MPIFKVKSKVLTEENPRLVKAENVKEVREHLLNEVEITRAEPEETHELGTQGVKIEQATE